MPTEPIRRSRGFRSIPVLAGLVALFVLAPGTADASSGKSFSLVSLSSDAVVAADGSMTVTETITYEFGGGPFTIGTRSFFAADRDRIDDFSATEDGVELDVDPPGDTPTGEWEWHFDTPATDEQRTFELSYTVDDAIELGSDVGELYWQFLGTDHPGIGSVDIHITVPGDVPAATATTPADDTEVLRAWGHGPTNGRVVVGTGEVDLGVVDVPAGQFVEARLAIPAEVFAGVPGDARLPAILAEESGFIDAMNPDAGRAYEPPPSTAVRLVGPIGALVGIGGLAALWRRFGREPKPDPMIGDYWREPLTEPPAVVLTNMSKGSVSLSDAIGATIIDLAQRGHLTIREEREERFGPDKTTVHLTRTGAPGDDLAPFEQRLLSYVFSAGPTTTTEEVTDRASGDQTTAVAFSKAFQSDISAAFKQRSYLQRGLAGWPWVLGLAVGVAAIGLVALVLGTALGFVAIVVAPILGVVGLVALRNRSQAGADELARAEALKRYLEDFSNLKEAPAGHLILWERFLVFAVAFGVAGKLLAGLAARLPTVVNDPSYGIWYAGAGARRFDGIDRIPAEFGSAAASAMTPSKSGSGGGFSGGGGGGGGGGGFGAR